MSSLDLDADYCDSHFELSSGEKRHVRISTKTYEQSGTYISLKLFKRENGESQFTFSQRITLSLDEFNKLTSEWDSMLKSLNLQEAPLNVPDAKKPRRATSSSSSPSSSTISTFKPATKKRVKETLTAVVNMEDTD